MNINEWSELIHKIIEVIYVPQVQSGNHPNTSIQNLFKEGNRVNLDGLILPLMIQNLLLGFDHHHNLWKLFFLRRVYKLHPYSFCLRS